MGVAGHNDPMRAPVPALLHPGPTSGLHASPPHLQPAGPISSQRQLPGPTLEPLALNRRLARALSSLLAIVLLLVGSVSALAAPAGAALDDDRYDGNIFALYAGNGSLVPPRSSLAQAQLGGRVTVLIYYLDDSSASKRFAPVVSELQRLWGQTIELIPLVTDPLQDRPIEGPADPAGYWNGTIPQVVIFDGNGKLVFDASGQVNVDAINSVISAATGIPMAPRSGNSTTVSFNELNSEVVPSS